MFFFNKMSFRFLFFLFIGGLFFLTNACGTAERATQKRSKNINKGSVELPDITIVDSTNEDPNLPPTKTLVTPEDEDVETVSLIEKGRASWYGPNFHGKLTANGEQFDMHGMTAAHRTLPFNTIVLVENKDSGKSVLVRINDRGPFAKNRIIDLSKKAAREIGMIGPGTANVNLYVAKDALENSKTTNLKVATYTVQLGSFETEAQAFNYSSKIKGSRVEVVRKNTDKIYRVYYGRYIDKEEAAKKQKELERKNFSGYVKQIENG